MNSTNEQKRALRTLIREKRKTREQLAITPRILTHPIYLEADMVFCYAATPYEMDVTLVAESAFKAGKIVAFPRSGEHGILTFHTVKDLSTLTKGAYGILEPSREAQEVVGTENTLLLVPGLTFDENGYRLGYGGGYYDRYLARFQGNTLGVIRQEDLLSLGEIPKEEHDLSVAYLATENKIIQTRKSYDTGF